MLFIGASLPKFQIKMVKILYIEDNEDDYLILRGILAKVPDGAYALLNADSVQNALDYLSKEKIDLVFLDLGLPGCSGKEAYGKLAAQFPNIPVVIMSGNEDKKVAYELIALGAEDFFIKGGLHPDLLDRGITYSLKRHELKYLLKAEVSQRRKVEEALLRAHEELEARVKERTHELKETTEELKRSNEELEQYAYVASHDLQEPIRKIVGFSQILASKFEGQIDEKSKEHLSYVVDGAKRMQALIQDLLLYARMERKELTMELLNFNGVVKEAIGNLELVIKETKAEIIYDQLPCLSAHKSFMVQLFQNLISNSIKYRSEKTPRVEISAHPKEDQWEFTVADNGIGIDYQFANRLFVLFQRLHPKGKYQGTGIGLAVCKRMVEAHKGKIWIEPHAGEGAVFKFTLPRLE